MFTVFKREKQFIIHKGLPIVYALIIFIVSSFPGHKLPPIGIHFEDKVLHFLEFGMLGILIYQA